MVAGMTAVSDGGGKQHSDPTQNEPCLRPEGAIENGLGRQPQVKRPQPTTAPPRRGGAFERRPFGAVVLVREAFNPGLPPRATFGRPVGAKTAGHFFNLSARNLSVSRVESAFAFPSQPWASPGTSTNFTGTWKSLSFSANSRDCSIGTTQSLVP